MVLCVALQMALDICRKDKRTEKWTIGESCVAMYVLWVTQLDSFYGTLPRDFTL